MLALSVIAAAGVSLVGYAARREDVGRLCRVAFLVVAALVGFVRTVESRRVRCEPHRLCAFGSPASIVAEGWLLQEPERRSGRVRFDLRLFRALGSDGWRSVGDVTRVSARDVDRSWHLGSCMRARLRLRRPRNFGNPGAFDYVGYLRRRGIATTASVWNAGDVEPCRGSALEGRSIALSARRRVVRAIDAAVGSSSAALLRALVLGDTAGVSREQRDRHARAGTSHVLAVSGLHLTLVAGATFFLVRALVLRWVGVAARGWAIRIGAAVALLPALAYAALAGGRPPTLRAASMLFVYSVGTVLLRRPDPVQSLSIAAIWIGLAWPDAAVDPSFQFTFVAVLGLLRGSRGWRRGGAMRGSEGRATMLSGLKEHGLGCFKAALFASLATAPLGALYFNRVSLVGPLVNVAAVPVYGAVILFGLAGAALAFVNEALATSSFVIAGAILGVGEGIVSWVARFPGAAVRVVTPSGLEIAILFAGLWFVIGRRRAPHWLIVALVLAAAGDVAYWTRERFARDTMRVTFLDVGQGDSAVVEFASSKVLVIDGGGFAGSDFDTGEAIVARFLWSRKILRVDYVSMSHGDVDHSGGLPFVIEQFRPREFWWNGRSLDGERFRRLARALEKRAVRRRILAQESPPILLGESRIEVLHPRAEGVPWMSANDASLVLKLVHGRTTILFTGDVEQGAERALARTQGLRLRSDILKVPHHGSRTSSSDGFLDAVTPTLGIVSVGAMNRYRFPHAAVRRRYRERNVCVLRTDRSGAISVYVDRRGYQAEPGCATDAQRVQLD